MSNTSQIGATLSDLVAHVHALVTEDETSDSLAQRLREIRSGASSIVRYAEAIAGERLSQKRERKEGP